MRVLIDIYSTNLNQFPINVQFITKYAYFTLGVIFYKKKNDNNIIEPSNNNNNIQNRIIILHEIGFTT